MFKDGPINGLILKPLTKYEDDRGWLTEVFREDEIHKEAIPVMSYVSATKPGKSRGPHEHIKQTDYFVFIGPGTFLFMAWDNRKDNPTYNNRTALMVGTDNNMAIIVPPGIVHAYANISRETGLVYNLPSKLYAGWNKKEKIDEIRHEDNISSPFVTNFSVKIESEMNNGNT